MIDWKATIICRPVTKKNSQQICLNKKTGKRFIRQSEAYTNFELVCRYQIRRPRAPIAYPVEVEELFYMPDNRRVDLTNLEEAIDDVLVKNKVLADDNAKIIVSHDGSRVFFGSSNPRIEITIRRCDHAERET